MPDLLTGKVAVVTGGASGIGLAAVRRFLEEGAKVVISDIQNDAGRRLASELGDAAPFVQTDVSSAVQIETAVAAAVRGFGRLDIMFNNAAIIGDRASMMEVGSSDFDDVIAINARSVLLGHKFAARQFQAQGTGGDESHHQVERGRGYYLEASQPST